jgi:hypothetical protein
MTTVIFFLGGWELPKFLFFFNFCPFNFLNYR